MACAKRSRAVALHDILHQLRAVSFNPHPLFAFPDTFVGKALPTEPVLGHPGLDKESFRPEGRVTNKMPER